MKTLPRTRMFTTQSSAAKVKPSVLVSITSVRSLTRLPINDSQARR